MALKTRSLVLEGSVRSWIDAFSVQGPCSPTCQGTQGWKEVWIRTAASGTGAWEAAVLLWLSIHRGSDPREGQEWSRGIAAPASACVWACITLSGTIEQRHLCLSAYLVRERVPQLPVCLAGVQVTVTAVLQPKRGVCGLKSQWWSRAWSTGCPDGS